MFDDISFLVQETFNEAAKFADNALGKEVPEECSGVLFHVEKQTSTFVIRILTSENLAQDFNKVSNNTDAYPNLRLEDAQALSFFATDNLNLAQIIKERFANKRFPIFEENILNVSDPGDSWYMDLASEKIKINFKLSATNILEHFLKIGPVGDAAETFKNFSNLGGYFQMLFPLSDYTCTSNQLEISCSEVNNPVFAGLKNLFERGEATHEFWEALRSVEKNHMNESYIESLREANQYMLQLSLLRSFWIDVQKRIES